MRNILDSDIQRFAFWQAVVFFTGCLLLSGCKDDQLLGLEIQPEGQLDHIQSTDTLTVRAFTLEGTTQRSDEAQSYIGKIQSPVFGKTESALILNFAAQTGLFTKKDYNADSVVLHLKPIYTYGNYKDPIPVAIYRVDEQLFKDEAYNHDYEPAIISSSIGNYVLQRSTPLDVKDSIHVGGGLNEAFQFRIPLDMAIAEELFTWVKGTVSNDEQFQASFEGLLIRVTEAMDPSLTGAFYGFDLTSGESGLRLYISQGGTNKEMIKFEIKSTTARINQFKHDYTGSTVATYLNNDQNNDDLLFIQGMGGTRAEIQIPHIDKFAADKNLAIHKASLTFKISDQQPGNLRNSLQLFLLDIKDDGEESLTLDYSESRSDGKISADSTSYTFEVTRHVQRILDNQRNGITGNPNLRLHAQVPVINGNDPGHNVLEGSGNIVLKLFYTDLKD